ncbi:MAG: deoxyguanosinetriphosphate triphosphohydrolase, partial [Acidobacteriaceae bacterium]
GIIKHSRDYSVAEHPELKAYLLDERPPLEAQLIDLADEIAYLTADFDDGIESGLLDFEHVRKHVPLVGESYARAALAHGDAEASGMQHRMVSESLKRVLDALTGDLITETRQRVEGGGFAALAAIRLAPERLARFSPGMERMRREAKHYLSTHLYNSEEVARHHAQAATVIAALFECWVADPSLLPIGCATSLVQEGVPRTVADYIAGMTDNFILAQYEATAGDVHARNIR